MYLQVENAEELQSCFISKENQITMKVLVIAEIPVDTIETEGTVASWRMHEI